LSIHDALHHVNPLHLHLGIDRDDSDVTLRRGVAHGGGAHRLTVQGRTPRVDGAVAEDLRGDARP
jgi:hypothetical protein